VSLYFGSYFLKKKKTTVLGIHNMCVIVLKDIQV
jgi:hypothetical protein